MRFKEALWDSSDPSYAPCITWARNSAFWKCPKKYAEAGYPTASVNLHMKGDKTDEHQADRALKCRELTRKLVTWWENFDKPDETIGTWVWLINRYKGDEFSPFNEVKANTQQGYIDQIKRLEAAIGHMKISDITFEAVKRMEYAMREKGRSVDAINRLFNTLRQIAGYGAMLGIQEAVVVKNVLSEMRFKKAPPRNVIVPREDVLKIVAKADEAGAQGFAVGVLLQYEFMLRAVDIRGQWLKAKPEEGGIQRNGTRWQDGMTWKMIDPDFTSFTKVISKTINSLPEAYSFDLTLVPEIRERLQAIGSNGRVGPVILNKFREPYTANGWRQAWNRYRDQAGVSKEFRVMDLRASGVTEASSMGASAYTLRDAAQHKNTTTTDRYSRGRSEAANKVVLLRRGK